MGLHRVPATIQLFVGRNVVSRFARIINTTVVLCVVYIYVDINSIPGMYSSTYEVLNLSYVSYGPSVEVLVCIIR